MINSMIPAVSLKIEYLSYYAESVQRRYRDQIEYHQHYIHRHHIIQDIKRCLSGAVQNRRTHGVHQSFSPSEAAKMAIIKLAITPASATRSSSLLLCL